MGIQIRMLAESPSRVGDAVAPEPEMQGYDRSGRGILNWLQIWEQVLIAELLSALEQRRVELS